MQPFKTLYQLLIYALRHDNGNCFRIGTRSLSNFKMTLGHSLLNNKKS